MHQNKCRLKVHTFQLFCLYDNYMCVKGHFNMETNAKACVSSANSDTDGILT